MISYAEIRIGNIFDILKEVKGVKVPVGSLLRIEGIGIAGGVIAIDHGKIPACTPLSEYRNVSITNLSPVPITEEWLLKFGFKDVDITWNDNTITRQALKRDRYFLIPGVNGGWILSQIISSEANFITTVDYIHDLQNLYYDLANEELVLSTQETSLKETIKNPNN